MSELSKVTTILFDGDGVLWRAEQPIPGIRPLFEYLNRKGIKWALLTNNNTQTAKNYIDKLIGFGIKTDPRSVFTSSTVTAAYLIEKFGSAARLHVVGMDGLLNTLEDAGFLITTGESQPAHPVVAVVAGMDRQITHDKIKVAMRLILAGADFIATNTDGSFVTPEGFNPGTGMVIGALQFTTGVEPVVIGKPEAAIFKAALKHFFASPAEALMVGDRLNTDILGANRLGILTAAVLTGVTNREEIAASEIKPDLVYDDITGLHQALEAAFGCMWPRP